MTIWVRVFKVGHCAEDLEDYPEIPPGAEERP